MHCVGVRGPVRPVEGEEGVGAGEVAGVNDSLIEHVTCEIGGHQRRTLLAMP